MTILKDPVRPLDPSMPEPTPRPAEDVRTAMRPHGSRGKTSFELASPGGYLRKVTGWIAYLDEDADTYMVLRRPRPRPGPTTRHHGTARRAGERRAPGPIRQCVRIRWFAAGASASSSVSSAIRSTSTVCKLNENVVPVPSWESTQIRPDIASTSVRAM
jgi:hypothetical protein